MSKRRITTSTNSKNTFVIHQPDLAVIEIIFNNLTHYFQIILSTWSVDYQRPKVIDYLLTILFLPIVIVEYLGCYCLPLWTALKFSQSKEFTNEMRSWILTYQLWNFCSFKTFLSFPSFVFNTGCKQNNLKVILFPTYMRIFL